MSSANTVADLVMQAPAVARAHATYRQASHVYESARRHGGTNWVTQHRMETARDAFEAAVREETRRLMASADPGEPSHDDPEDEPKKPLEKKPKKRNTKKGKKAAMKTKSRKVNPEVFEADPEYLAGAAAARAEMVPDAKLVASVRASRGVAEDEARRVLGGRPLNSLEDLSGAAMQQSDNPCEIVAAASAGFSSVEEYRGAVAAMRGAR